jgi:hypothetical protein
LPLQICLNFCSISSIKKSYSFFYLGRFFVLASIFFAAIVCSGATCMQRWA